MNFLIEIFLEETKLNENSSLIQSSNEFPNRTNSMNETNGLSSDQALRLYTQYVQEVGLKC